MASVPFKRIPNDIFIQIIIQTKRNSEKNGHLFSYLLVNKQWYEATIPILYGNIVLNSSTLGPFIKCLDLSKCSSHVRSLTIRTQLSLTRNDTWGEVLDDDPSHSEEDRQLCRLLSNLDNLSSFSLKVSKFCRPISRSALVGIINALPESCICLEIESQHDPRGTVEKDHVCDAIRNILPRMRHIRLRFGAMCGSLFVDQSRPDEYLRLPHLRTLVVNCLLPDRGGLPLQVCGLNDNLTSSMYDHNPNPAWPSVTSSLEHLVEKEGAIPRVAKVYAIMMADYDFSDKSLWPAYIRSDMLAKESLAIPHQNMPQWGTNIGRYFVRFEGGRDLVCGEPTAGALAEGRLWRDVVGGARLPAEVLEAERLGKPSFATGCVEDPLWVTIFKEYQKESEENLELWYETQTGVRLIEPEKRIGKDRYLLLDPAREITPPGWIRVGSKNILEKVKD